MRLIKFKTDLKESDVTPKDVFVNRRQLFAGSALAAMTGAMPSLGFAKDDQSAIHYPVPTWLEQQLASSTLDENQQGQTCMGRAMLLGPAGWVLKTKSGVQVVNEGHNYLGHTPRPGRTPDHLGHFLNKHIGD